MPFDWNTYKDLAENLRQQPDEASKRSAISRLYYSIYHNAKKYLENKRGFIFSENKPSHQQVWNAFIDIGGTFGNIGQNGKRLLKNRNCADYEEINRVDDILETSFRLGNNTLAYIKQVQGRDE